MAYFANGSEGDRFQAKYCDRCIHWSPEKGCPVFNAHLDYNYEECDSGSNAEKILNMLIPQIENEHGSFPGECSMFHNATAHRSFGEADGCQNSQKEKS